MTIQKTEVRQATFHDLRLSRLARRWLSYLQGFSRNKKILFDEIIEYLPTDRYIIYKALKELEAKALIIHCVSQGYIVVKQCAKPHKLDVTFPKMLRHAVSTQDDISCQAQLPALPHLISMDCKTGAGAQASHYPA